MLMAKPHCTLCMCVCVCVPHENCSTCLPLIISPLTLNHTDFPLANIQSFVDKLYLKFAILAFFVHAVVPTRHSGWRNDRAIISDVFEDHMHHRFTSVPKHCKATVNQYKSAGFPSAITSKISNPYSIHYRDRLACIRHSWKLCVTLANCQTVVRTVCTESLIPPAFTCWRAAALIGRTSGDSARATRSTPVKLQSLHSSRLSPPLQIQRWPMLNARIPKHTNAYCVNNLHHL